ncbi:MAG: hypothetical protein AUJ52_04830 [Elusimicrobia bacterium CG1_02_63_36]|nr:MAG: hypothetical protein AUJ52_04830 [Elusimicrobia bacterium CG1_02_63_36]
MLNRILVVAGGTAPDIRVAAPHELLFAVRVRIGMSQAEAAARAGISQPTWQELESGRRDAGIRSWRRAFAGLECDLALMPVPRRHLGEWRAQRALERRWAARSVTRISEAF